MIIVKSKNDVPLRLTKERWNHIIARHPELKSRKGGGYYGSDKDT